MAFDAAIVSRSEGSVVLKVSGDGATHLFAKEAGGHRWQRIPPTERGGRVHSSTVTVAVFGPSVRRQVEFREDDCEFTATKGSGPGGQKKNKTSSVIVARHRPSGMVVRCETERSQSQNKAQAIALLKQRLQAIDDTRHKTQEDSSRREQVGSGMRADKIRTVQVKNNVVMNHITGRKCPLERYLKGDIGAIA